MRRLSWLAALVAALMLTGCAASVQTSGSSTASADDAEAYAPRLAFPYSGERQAAEDAWWPDYYVSTVRFGDVSIHPITYPGWTADRLNQMVLMRNPELGAVITITSARYPDLEVLRQGRAARADGLTVTDAVIGADARLTSHISFTQADAPDAERRVGHLFGLYTDYADADSGVVLFGHWPAEHDATLAPQLERIARNLVIRSCRSTTRGAPGGG